MTALALTATGIEKFAVEIRHLMRTEVGEAQEAFSKGQKGSSAMPHKKNPILSENLTGLARLIRGYSLSAMENIPLWHERDISHSSVERVIFPDATLVMDFMLHRFTSMVETLLVNEERMGQNMELSGGTTFSQTLLLALVDASMTREEAYAIVQRNAHKAMDSGRAFSDLVREDPDVGKVLDPAAVDSVFDPAAMLKRTGIIFDRVFGEEK